MTKVVNPINRTNDEMESKACGCKCICNEYSGSVVKTKI